MKILQIAPPWVDTPPQGYGGTEWVIHNLVKGLVNLDQDVTLFATKGSKIKGAKVKYLYSKNLISQDIPWNLALPSFLHYHQSFKIARKFDIVHAHLSSFTDPMIMAFLSDLKEQNIPCVMTIHSPFPLDTFSNHDEYFLNLYAKNITVVNISQTMASKMPSKFKKGSVILNSLDISKLKFGKKPKNYLTWIGQIIPKKGLLEAIQAAKLSGVKFIFAGVVEKHRPGSLEYFEQKIKPLIDGKSVIYLGPADQKTKNKLLSEALGFLNPIQWDEPFGMVMAESMACGTPVIAFKKGAAKEIIKNGKNGYLVNDLEEMVNKIKDLNKIKRESCREYVKNSFSIDSCAKRYLNVYRKEIHKTRDRFARKLQRITRKSPILDISSYPIRNNKLLD